jgi:hypothetical protein
MWDDSRAVAFVAPFRPKKAIGAGALGFRREGTRALQMPFASGIAGGRPVFGPNKFYERGCQEGAADKAADLVG